MNKKITLIIFALICFFVDGTMLCVFEQPTSQLLLSLALYSITFYTFSDALIACSFIGIQDLLFFGYTGIQLLYLLPLCIISYITSRIMYATYTQLIITAIVTSFLQVYLIRHYLLRSVITPFYTVHTLCGIIIGVVLISLIVWLSGLLGNRIHA